MTTIGKRAKIALCDATAKRCPQIHHGLIDICCIAQFCDVIGQFDEPLARCPARHIAFDPKKARKHALGIPIDCRHILTKCKRGNRTTRVIADTGYLAQCLDRRRKYAAALRCDVLSPCMEISRTAIIPEPCPCSEYVVDVARCKRVNIGKSLHPSFVIWQNRRNLRLL